MAFENDPGAFGNVEYGISIRFEFKAGALTAEEALRYAMSLPVATTITGIDSMDVVHQNLQKLLQEHCHDGWLAVYRSDDPNQRCCRALRGQTVGDGR